MKWILILLVSGLFTVGGYFMVADRAPSGWFVLVFFGACTIVAAMLLLPGAGGLSLDRQGFRATSLFRGFDARWQDVSGFEPVSIPPSLQKLVGYDDIKLAGRAAAKLSIAIAGHNSALPDTYGLSAQDLAWLMAAWRDRTLAG
jgi:hypothetical protein